MDKPDFLGTRRARADGGLPDDRRLLGFTMPGPAPFEGSAILARRRGGGRGDVELRLTDPRTRRAARLAAPAPGTRPDAPRASVEIDGRTATTCRDPVLRPGGIPCRAPEPFAGLAGRGAPPAPWTRSSGTGAGMALRIAADDLLVLIGRGAAQPSMTRDAIVEPETGFVAWALDPPAVRALWSACGLAASGPRARPWPRAWWRRSRPSCGCGRTVRRCCCASRRTPPSLEARLAMNEFVETLLDLTWPGAPEPKRSYDVVIIGGGGHGLSTAYHLATRHGITDVAVLERGLHRLGQLRPQHHDHPCQLRAAGGRPLLPAQPGAVPAAGGRDRRRHHALDQGAALAGPFDHRRPYRAVPGVVEHRVWRATRPTSARRRSPASAPRSTCTAAVATRCSVPRTTSTPPPPGTIAWCGRTRRARCGWASMCCRASRSPALSVEHDRVTGVETATGPIAAGTVLSAVGGHVTRVAGWAGVRLPIRTHTLQAFVTNGYAREFEPIVSSNDLVFYVSQTARGQMLDRRRVRPPAQLLQRHDVRLPPGLRPQGDHRPAVPGSPASPTAMGGGLRRVARLLAHLG